jgi:hypothetical protein
MHSIGCLRPLRVGRGTPPSLQAQSLCPKAPRSRVAGKFIACLRALVVLEPFGGKIVRWEGRLKDVRTGFGKGYLRLPVDEIRLEGNQLTIRGSYSKLQTPLGGSKR